VPADGAAGGAAPAAGGDVDQFAEVGGALLPAGGPAAVAEQRHRSALPADVGATEQRGEPLVPDALLGDEPLEVDRRCDVDLPLSPPQHRVGR
jgi:hypothetical protein